MAFYGDNPFQGDPAFNYRDSVNWKSAQAIRKAVIGGFDQAGSLGAFDVDACVWAWACAEMLALALGRPSSPRAADAFRCSRADPRSRGSRPARSSSPEPRSGTKDL